MTKRRHVPVCTALWLTAALVLAGCAQEPARSAPATTQGVGDVVQEQMRKEDDQKAPESAQTAPAPEQSAFVGDATPGFGEVDYDLTAMGPDMVYATVFDMVSDPSKYVGKVVRMAGPYYHTFYEPTQTDYFYVIIQDATACCSQGLEFVWGDGTHAYPAEYPTDGTEVVVTGQFETYVEGTQSYIHLVNASMQVA